MPVDNDSVFSVGSEMKHKAAMGSPSRLQQPQPKCCWHKVQAKMVMEPRRWENVIMLSHVDVTEQVWHLGRAGCVGGGLDWKGLDSSKDWLELLLASWLSGWVAASVGVSVCSHLPDT